jgi:HK97 family phage major capsid protein
MSLSSKAILEISELSHRAESLARGSATERKQADILVQRIGTIKQTGMSSDEVRARYADALNDQLSPRKETAGDAEQRGKFGAYVSGKIAEREYRDWLAGTQSITYTQGAVGGFTVPFVYDGTLRTAMAQVDPVLNGAVTDFTMTDAPTLQPEQLSGFDLSTISASLVGETVQQNPQAIPTVLGAVLRNNLVFKATFAASYEAEIDIPQFAEKIVKASGVALARTIGLHVLTGRGGTTDITGITTQMGVPSVTNATSGKLTLADLNNIYFAVNRFYRAAPKVAFLVSDGAYKFIRNAVDNSGRPLIDVIDGQESIYGKPIYLCPSLGAVFSSIGLTGAIIFGDLSHLVVRASRPTLTRSLEQTQADVTKGEALYIARCRADASYFDPSNGAFPPMVLAAVN